MEYKFQLPDFPDSSFKLETSFWTGKYKLTKDGEQLTQSNEKGTPFFISKPNGEVLKAYLKYSMKIPVLEINGKRYGVGKQLKWFEYLIASIPLLLAMIASGFNPPFALFFGIFTGFIGTIINTSILWQEGRTLSKYIKVVMVCAICCFVYFAYVSLILLLKK